MSTTGYLSEPSPINCHQERGLQGHCPLCSTLWVRGMDYQGPQFETAKWLPQPLYPYHHGCNEATAMEAENYIKGARF